MMSSADARLATYGGRVNTVAPDATASAQRNAISTLHARPGGWIRKEAQNLAWCVRSIAIYLPLPAVRRYLGSVRGRTDQSSGR